MQTLGAKGRQCVLTAFSLVSGAREPLASHLQPLGFGAGLGIRCRPRCLATQPAPALRPGALPHLVLLTVRDAQASNREGACGGRI